MRKTTSTSVALMIASALALPALPALAADSPKSDQNSAAHMSKQQELVTEAQYTAHRFADDSGIEWVRKNVGHVKGVFIIPEQIKGAFMVGASGGSGVMLAHRKDGAWSDPGFYTMGSLSFGFQAGGEVSEIVLLVMTDKGLDAFKNTSVKLGADVSVAAGPVGAGAKAATADVLAFSRQKGLYGGVSVEGAVITTRDEWNTAYYDKPMTPGQLLFTKSPGNPNAEGLRREVAQLFGGSPQPRADNTR
jgi:lipid-binding SYLF domain-containing protein